MNKTLRTALSLQVARRHAQAGVTLIESLMVLAVGTVALGAAAPGFESARERRQIESAAAQFETDVQHARSLAAARSQAVRVTFSSGADNSCYVVHTGDAGDCPCVADGRPVCSDGAHVLQTMHWPAATGIRISANVRSMVFEPSRGTITPAATVKVQGSTGSLHQVVNIMGRVRTCTPVNASLPGYRGC